MCERVDLKLIRKVFRELKGEELQVFLYFLREYSVGNILAFNELKRKGIVKPERHVKRLVMKGYLEYGEGCINLAEWVRKELSKVRHSGETVVEAGRRIADLIEKLKAPIMEVLP